APVSGQAFSSAVTEASRQINALTSTSQALIDTVLANTQAVVQNSASQKPPDRKSTRLNSSHVAISYAVFCLKKKKKKKKRNKRQKKKKKKKKIIIKKK